MMTGQSSGIIQPTDILKKERIANMDKTKETRQAAEEIKDFVDELTEEEAKSFAEFISGVRFAKSLRRGKQESA